MRVLRHCGPVILVVTSYLLLCPGAHSTDPTQQHSVQGRVDYWAEFLVHESVSRRDAAAAMLAELGPPAVPVLVDALSHPQRGVREAAARGLGLMPCGDRRAVRRLADLIEDPEPRVRQAAVVALSCIGSKAGPAVPALVKALGEADRPRRTVIKALGEVRVRPRRSVPALLEAIKSPGSRRIFDALRKYGPEAAPAIPEILRALEDEDQRVQSMAVELLSRIGPGAASAVPALQRYARRTGEWYEVIEALAGIGRPALGALAESIVESEDGRKYAPEFLADVGSEAQPAVPYLVRILKRTQNESAPRIAAAVAESGEAGVAALVRVLEKDGHDESLYITAIRALERAEEMQEGITLAAVPALLRFLELPEDTEELLHFVGRLWNFCDHAPPPPLVGLHQNAVATLDYILSDDAALLLASLSSRDRRERQGAVVALASSRPKTPNSLMRWH